MAKRNPPTPKTKKRIEQQQKFAAFKTAVPLVLTLGLLALLYVFVLLPEEPANVLKRAVVNSLDTEKYQSVRYDGSFGDDNRGIAGEFIGQKAKNGDMELRIRLKEDSLTTAIETRLISRVTYVRVSGIENLKEITDDITGIKQPSDEMIATLSEVQNTWVKLDGVLAEGVVNALPCSSGLPTLSQATMKPITDSAYPFEYVSGPTLPKDDSEDEIYEAKIITTDRPKGDAEKLLEETLNCLEAEYGQDDFRLREAGPADIESAKVTFTVDPLSSTVKQMTIKQVGMYFNLMLRDYNKDVTIPVPDNATDLATLYNSLSPQAKTYISTQLNLPAL